MHSRTRRMRRKATPNSNRASRKPSRNRSMLSSSHSMLNSNGKIRTGSKIAASNSNGKIGANNSRVLSNSGSSRNMPNNSGRTSSRPSNGSGRTRATSNNSELSNRSRSGASSNSTPSSSNARTRTASDSARNNKGKTGTISNSMLSNNGRTRTTGNSAARTGSGATNKRETRPSSTASSRAPGNSIVHSAGTPTTVPGNGAVAITDTACLTIVTADTSARTTGSASMACPSWWLVDIRAFSTRAIGSLPLTHGRNIGEMTGTTMTTSMSPMSTTAITCTTAGIPTSELQSAFRCSSTPSAASEEAALKRKYYRLETRSESCLEQY